MQPLNVDRNVLTSNLADFSGGETTDIPPENNGLESDTSKSTDSQEVIEDETENIDLSEMTKAELLDYAENNDIEGVDGSMRKKDIIETIETAENVENSVENVGSEDIEENAE